MRISANHVTFARLLLLPLPVALVYHGGQSWWLAALAAYTVLGLTDALDGMLARRHGATPLGALLDPIADKIFLVAAYGPLVDLGVVPISLVTVLFVRELAVTALRSISLEEDFHFRTSRVAKLKTAVQMGGAGFILLLWLFAERAVVLPILLAAVALAALPAALLVARRQRPGWMSLWSLGLVAYVTAVRLLASPRPAILLIAGFIVGLTLYSGGEYAWGMRRVLAERFVRRPIEMLRLAGLSLCAPLFFLPGLAWAEAPSLTILMVLAVELAAGGLDNSLVQSGHRRGPAADLLRSLGQALLGSALLIGLATGQPPLLVYLCGWGALVLTLGDVTGRLVRHRHALHGAAPGTTSLSSGASS